MAWTREAIEAVLWKHDPRRNELWEIKRLAIQPLIDALLALRPEPDREALEKILQKQHPCYHKDSACWQELVEPILAWSRGEAGRPKEWCRHVTWHPPTATTASIGIGAGWWIAGEGHLPTGVDDDWTVCPICAAPRPEKS